MYGIYWTKSDGSINSERDVPYPSYNKLRGKILINSSCYVNLNMMREALNLYDEATNEIIKLHNKGNEEIIKLQKENMEQEKIINDLQEQLKKWTSQQGKGKRTSKKLLERKDDIVNWKIEKISNREIARRLNVTEGTVRHFLKNFLM